MAACDPIPTVLLVLVEVSGQTLAVPAQAVAEMVHEPALIRPPRLPSAVEGVFRLRGRAVPVLCPDVLLGLPAPVPGPFRVLLVFRGADGLWALTVDRALSVVQVRTDSLLAVPAGHSLGECVGALHGDVPVLAPDRLLSRREALVVADVGRWADQRWEDFALANP